MAEREQDKEKRAAYACELCKQRYDLTRARMKELSCCGRAMTKLEIVTKSDPTPFGA